MYMPFDLLFRWYFGLSMAIELLFIECWLEKIVSFQLIEEITASLDFHIFVQIHYYSIIQFSWLHLVSLCTIAWQSFALEVILNGVIEIREEKFRDVDDSFFSSPPQKKLFTCKLRSFTRSYFSYLDRHARIWWVSSGTMECRLDASYYHENVGIWSPAPSFHRSKLWLVEPHQSRTQHYICCFERRVSLIPALDEETDEIVGEVYWHFQPSID